MLLTIDIGSKYIHFAEGEYKGKKVNIQRFIQELTPEGCIEDGEIVDFTRLKMKLKEILTVHKVKSKNVILTIDSTRMISREISIPKVKPKEIYAVLEGELSGMLSEEEAYLLEYTLVDTQEVDQLRVKFTALPSVVVENYKKLLEELKLRPVALDIHHNAIEGFMSLVEERKENNIVIADIGNSYLDLHLFNNQERTFSRKTFINTAQCEKTLLAVRRIEKENKDFYNLAICSEKLEEDYVLDSTLSPYLNNIIQQLTSIVQFQLGLGQSKPVEAIYLTGGMSQLEGIASYLEEAVGVPVYKIDQLIKVDDTDGNSGVMHTNAIGILRPKMNFFKRYKIVERQERSLSPQSVARSITLAVLAIGIGVSTLTLQMMKLDVQREINAITRFLESEEVKTQLAIVETKSKELNAVTSYNEAVLSADTKIKTLPEINHQVIGALAKTLPEGVKVKQLNYTQGNLVLSCVSTSKQEINTFVHALRKVKYVQSINYTGYVQTEGSYQFTIGIILTPGGES